MKKFNEWKEIHEGANDDQLRDGVQQLRRQLAQLKNSFKGKGDFMDEHVIKGFGQADNALMSLLGMLQDVPVGGYLGSQPWAKI